MSHGRARGPLTAATYLLIHGAGDPGWYWHRVEAELRERGHDVVVMDLPVEDDSAGLSAYADVVGEAIGDRDNLIAVAQSFGGYIAPIVCERVPVRLLVLVAALSHPGELAQRLEAYRADAWRGRDNEQACGHDAYQVK